MPHTAISIGIRTLSDKCILLKQNKKAFYKKTIYEQYAQSSHSKQRIVLGGSSMTELENKIYLVIANANGIKGSGIAAQLGVEKRIVNFHTGEQLGIEGCRQTRIGF